MGLRLRPALRHRPRRLRHPGPHGQGLRPRVRPHHRGAPEPVTRRVLVVGGGIVGLAVAERVLREDPAARVTVLEKETGWAQHQTGRNSGVVHSGLYYPPGSAKARWCRAGASQLLAFAEAEGVEHAVTGKLVVATDPAELPRLEALRRAGRGERPRRTAPRPCRGPRARAPRGHPGGPPRPGDRHHRLPRDLCRARPPARLRRRRAAARGRGPRRPGDAPARCHRRDRPSATSPPTSSSTARACTPTSSRCGSGTTRRCGSCPSAASTGARPHGDPPRARARLPGPDPELPFLGVHLTRGVDGHVHAGPNAVLALAREGYRWRDVDARDLGRHPRASRASGGSPGGRPRPAPGRSPARSRRDASATACAASSRPCATRTCSRPRPGCGRRRCGRDGTLVDDFLVERSGRCVHVLNAPSPAATAALEIARHVVGLLPQ